MVCSSEWSSSPVCWPHSSANLTSSRTNIQPQFCHHHVFRSFTPCLSTEFYPLGDHMAFLLWYLPLWTAYVHSSYHSPNPTFWASSCSVELRLNCHIGSLNIPPYPALAFVSTIPLPFQLEVEPTPLNLSHPLPIFPIYEATTTSCSGLPSPPPCRRERVPNCPTAPVCSPIPDFLGVHGTSP